RRSYDGHRDPLCWMDDRRCPAASHSCDYRLVILLAGARRCRGTKDGVPGLCKPIDQDPIDLRQFRCEAAADAPEAPWAGTTVFPRLCRPRRSVAAPTGLLEPVRDDRTEPHAPRWPG